MTLLKCILTANPCYKKGQKMTGGKPMGIVVHSTGANNRTIKRYVQPLKTDANYKEILADIGENKNGNHWNGTASNSVCVHAFIGVNAANKVETYQTLPWDMCCWGCGKASKGSYNYNPPRVQFEICEDGLEDRAYFNAAFKEAIELCVHLCKLYGISPDNIQSHHESHLAGYASNHGDCDHWLKKHNKDMNWFRAEVRAGLSENPTTVTVDPAGTLYKVQVGAFTIKTNADATLKNLKAKGFDAVLVKEGIHYKVQTGAFSLKPNAAALMAKLKANGFQATIITVKA